MYVFPLPVHRRPTASSDIPDWIDTGWYVKDLYLAMFYTIPYHRKRTMRMLGAPLSHSGYHDTTITFLV